MSKKRYLDTMFWLDGYTANLDPSEKLTYLYTLTCPATNISGAYEIPLKTIAADTGFDKDMLLKMFERFEDDDKITYRDGWMLVHNFIKHQNTESRSVIEGIKKSLKNAPEWVKDTILRRYRDGHIYLDLDFNLYFNSDLNKKPEGKKPLPDEIIELTQKLYDILEKPTRWDKKPPDLNKWAEEIEKLNRIDGISYELIETVINYISKFDRWKWKEVIQSGAGFRKHFDTIEKQMPKNKKRTSEGVQSDVEYYDEKIKRLSDEAC